MSSASLHKLKKTKIKEKKKKNRNNHSPFPNQSEASLFVAFFRGKTIRTFLSEIKLVFSSLLKMLATMKQFIVAEIKIN